MVDFIEWSVSSTRTQFLIAVGDHFHATTDTLTDFGDGAMAFCKDSTVTVDRPPDPSH